jgi:hypothetical protein
MSGEQTPVSRLHGVHACEISFSEKGSTMKYRDCKRRAYKDLNDRWMSIAIAAAAILATAACGGCLYTAIPAMAGPSTNYQAPTDNQPSQPPQSSPQSSNDQTNQNKQQNGAPQIGASPQGQGGATP